MSMRVLFEFPTIERFSVQVDDFRQRHLLKEIEGGGAEIQDLVGEVSSMPESKVQELVRELRTEGRR
jgi:hypothetical protein